MPLNGLAMVPVPPGKGPAGAARSGQAAMIPSRTGPPSQSACRLVYSSGGVMCRMSGLNGAGPVAVFARQVSRACALPPGRSTTRAWDSFIQIRWVVIGTLELLKKASPG